MTEVIERVKQRIFLLAIFHKLFHSMRNFSDFLLRVSFVFEWKRYTTQFIWYPAMSNQITMLQNQVIPKKFEIDGNGKAVQIEWYKDGGSEMVGKRELENRRKTKVILYKRIPVYIENKYKLPSRVQINDDHGKSKRKWWKVDKLLLKLYLKVEIRNSNINIIGKINGNNLTWVQYWILRCEMISHRSIGSQTFVIVVIDLNMI